MVCKTSDYSYCPASRRLLVDIGSGTLKSTEGTNPKVDRTAQAKYYEGC